MRIQDHLHNLAFLGDLSSSERNEIARYARLVEVAKGKIYALEGDPCTAVCFCVSGRLRALKTSPRGREQVIEEITPGRAFYLVPALDGGPLPATTRAVVESTVLSFARDDFAAILSRHPSVSHRMLIAFARRLRRLNTLVRDLALFSVPERLARVLLDRATHPGRPRTTQRELASQIGTVREVVARALSGFEQRGWVRVGRGRIEIVDAPALERIAMGDDV